MTGGQLVEFIFYGVLVGGGVGAVSETWGDLQRAAGASERLMELLHEVPAIAAPAHPLRLPEKSGGAVTFDNVTFRYPTRPDFEALNGFSLDVSRRARRWRWSVRPAPANPPCSSFCCASSRRRTARSPSTAWTSPTSIRPICAATSRWWRRSR